MKPETRYALLTALCRFVSFWIYCVLGALAFMAIEGGNDADNNRSLYDEIKKNLTAKYDINETVFDQLTEELEEATQNLVVDSNDWSFGNSLLFVETIVTTVGYGHITPVTTAGRLFCIIYGVIGIPICLAMLAIIGEVLKIGHLTWIRRLEERLPLPHLSCDAKCVVVCTVQMIVVIVIGAAIQIKVDNWSFVEGVYAWFVTFSTIGFGDMIPGYRFIEEAPGGAYRLLLVYRLFYDIFGLCVVAALLSSLSNIFQRCKFQSCCVVSDPQTKDGELEMNSVGNNSTIS